MQIGNYILDKYQEEIVKDESKYLLVTAGAGSGKTLTILAKIQYLIKYKNIQPDEILCLSFTKNSTEELKKKIKKEIFLDIETYTFHKLAVEILKKNKYNFSITEEFVLNEITKEFFEYDICLSAFFLKLICKYFNRSTFNYKREYLYIKKYFKDEFLELQKLCITFIRLMKCNNYNLESFILFKEKIKSLSYFRYRREKILLIFILNVYLKYMKYLNDNNEFDFDDLIIEATLCVKNNYFWKKSKYIIIDEYQDTSKIRFLLIKEIINKTGSKLMVVGDDFQSIYKFTGCDVSLFLEFNKYFCGAKIMSLNNTYRNSAELIKVASCFILKNKKQIRKNLISSKRLNEPIKIIKYCNIYDSFMNIIKELSYNKFNKILILGRNNKDINMILCDDIKYIDSKVIIKGYEYLDVTFMTVHKSKGLESDNVIILNLEDKITGFPCQIKDEYITRLVNNSTDKYPFAEERRLFYVALTRTKNYVYLLSPRSGESIFIKELEKIIKYYENNCLE